MILYIALGVLAVLTRFWDLSSRAEHHDESLHAYYSWLFYVGDGYVHDPLMHGPTLFHTNAFAYLLFGDNDYTSRLWPALLGVILVLMPILLRGPQLLGRWGALACSTLLLFSPSLLYQSRYIRHDPLVLVMTLAIVIAALRYLERPERRWVVTIAVMAGLLFATMEVSFIIAFVLVTFVAGIALWQISRPALGLLLLTGVGVLAVWRIMPALGAPSLPTIPWEHPTSANIRSFSQDLATHPIVLAALGVVLLGIVLVLGALDRVRDRGERNWIESVFAPAPEGTTANAFYNLVSDRRSLWIAVSLGLVLFAAFFTSMYTNMFGLGSGTVGALGYWLGQHDVQRADQPWFYYMLMLPQYEFVAVALFPFGVWLTARRLIPAIRRGEPVGRRNYMRGLFIYWAVVNLAIFSWAGEKMPWLTVHMALPMILLAASLIGGGVEGLEAAIARRELPRRMVWLVAGGIPLISAAWFALWAWGSAGPWQERDGFLQRSLRPEISDYPWLLYLPLLALLGLLGFAFWKLGPRLAMPLVGVTMVAVILAGQIHTSFRLTYFDGDVPVDMLVYVQTSPDVTRAVEEIGLLSRETTGGLDIPIAYDSGTSWPFQWYLRDYSQRRFYGETLSEPPDEPIVLISNEHIDDG
ncbi:MAG: flippase activity-associated protein Agl23, partial [Thermomicrobiales bacterium]